MITEPTRIAIEKALAAARELAAAVGRGEGGAEVTLTIRKLQEALHWLAEVK